VIAAQTVRVVDSRGLRVRVVAGQPVPSHLRTAYCDAVAPSPPLSDGLEALKRPALMRRAASLGVPAKGSNARIIAAIRAAASMRA
jgi:hypothetical protein